MSKKAKIMKDVLVYKKVFIIDIFAIALAL